MAAMANAAEPHHGYRMGFAGTRCWAAILLAVAGAHPFRVIR